MASAFSLIPSDAAVRLAADQLVALDTVTAAYGLTLGPAQATALVEAKEAALRHWGRVEFGPGILGKLAVAFCDSPYMTQACYAATLEELTTLFYELKAETLESWTDDELIQSMCAAFNGPCHGSLELLANRDMERLARAARGCGPAETGEEGCFDGEHWEWDQQ